MEANLLELIIDFAIARRYRRDTTFVAELMAAATGHVVTSLIALHDAPAVRTALPLRLQD